VGANRLDIRAYIEQATHASHDCRQRLHAWKLDRHAHTLALRQVCDCDTSRRSANLNRTPIASVLYHFDAGDRARPQEIEHGFPIIWRPVTYVEHDTRISTGAAYGRPSPQRAGRTAEEILKYFVEPTQAVETRR
jgi:hypothetical protein